MYTRDLTPQVYLERIKHPIRIAGFLHAHEIEIVSEIFPVSRYKSLEECK